MIGRDVTLVFEDDSARALFATLFPDPDATCVSFESLLRPLLPAEFPDAEGRRARFRDWLTPRQRERADGLWATVQALRAAQIGEREHVEFAFTDLADTPRHRELHAVMRAYVTSPLVTDIAWYAGRLVEALESGGVQTHGTPRYLFVRGARTSPLFADVAAAFPHAGGIESAELVDFWELPTGEEGVSAGHPLLVVRGDATAGLEGLGSALTAALERGVRPGRVILPVAAKPASLHWLRHFLHRHRVPYRMLEAPAAAPANPSPLGLLVEALRTDRRRPLFERLQLSARVLEETAQRRHGIDREALLTSLAGVLDEADVTYLRSLAATAPPPAKTPEEALLVVPFEALPPLPGRHCLAFADETALTAPADELLFSEAERDLLHERGFSLPRAATHRERLQARLAAMAAPRRGLHRLYTTLDPATLPVGTRRVRRRPRRTTEGRYAGGWTETGAIPWTLPVLSATQLETYARCPAQYLFGSRMKLRRRELAEGRHALLFGQATHKALETYFREHRGKETETPEAMVPGLVEAFRAALRELAPSLETTHPFSVLLVEQFGRFATAVPGLEAQLHRIAGDTTPWRFEEEFDVELDGLKVKGKIDRVDRRPDGTWLLIDYKTGTVDFTPDHVAQGKHFQALLYLLAAEQRFGAKGAGFAFYDLKAGEARRGVVFEAGADAAAKKAMTRGHVLDPAKLAVWKQAGNARLKEIAGRLGSGDFAPRAASEPCERCDYGGLCRGRLGYG